METAVFTIEGMMCEACSGHVARALEGLGGVASADVSLVERRAVVAYEPSQVALPAMMEAVAEEGYEATPVG